MSDEASTRTVEKPPAAPGLMQAALVALVVVAVAAVALTARQPAPPSVAEVAPQAVEQIKEAPKEQTAELGAGGGGGGTATTTTVPPTTTPSGPAAGGPKSIEKARVRRCFGDPPRQTEDPQSPPCVPYFDGTNSGASSHGVTADSINVFVPDAFLEDTAGVDDLFKFFNRRFEFYGRQLVPKHFTATGGDPSPTAMQADAQSVFDNNGFASLNYIPRSGAEFEYYDALAGLKVLSVAHAVQAGATEPRFRQHDPYEWSFLPGIDTQLRNYGQMICAELAHRPPRFAGTKESQAPDRVFGLILEGAADGTYPDPAPLNSELSRCGAAPVVTTRDKVDSSTGRNGEDVMLTMSNASPRPVTSVICLCDAVEVREPLMRAASSQAYQPEWLLGTYLDNDLDNSMNGAPPDQASHVLGLLSRNKLLPPQDMFWYGAIKEVDPGHDVSGGRYFALEARYSSLLLLASGIQAAGPNLTPQTFAQGLFRTQFANPGAGGPPYYQGRVGFDGGRHTMLGDGAMFWYDQARQSNVDPTNTGAVCYVRHGQRYGPGQWPRDDPPPFFTGDCL